MRASHLLHTLRDVDGLEWLLCKCGNIQQEIRADAWHDPSSRPLLFARRHQSLFVVGRTKVLEESDNAVPVHYPAS